MLRGIYGPFIDELVTIIDHLLYHELDYTIDKKSIYQALF